MGPRGLRADLGRLRRPGDALLVLVVAFGAWLILSGVVELVRVVLGGVDHRALRALDGVVDVALGVVVLALPSISLRTLATLIGVAFVARGAVLAVRGVRARGAGADVPLERGHLTAPSI